MNALKLYTSDKYIASPDLDGKEVNVVINAIKIEDVVGGPNADPKKRLVLYFTKGSKGMVLNKTNVKTIVKKLGTQNTDDWIGKGITIYPTTCSAFGNPKQDCIRIK